MAGTFRWEDPLLLDEQLTAEERLVRDSAREYAQEKLMPRVREANRHERFDPEILKELGERRRGRPGDEGRRGGGVHQGAHEEAGGRHPARRLRLHRK